jgi:hypothetical protein
MMPWRYQPKDNRTPVNHPVFGHLEYGTVVDNPGCAHDPNFVEVKPKQKPKAAKPKAEPANPSIKAAESGDSPADAPSASEPPAEQASAGKTGRS